MYTRDSKLSLILATCIRIFGKVLKIDSTKKMCKKLQWMAVGRAFWCKNGSNKRVKFYFGLVH